MLTRFRLLADLRERRSPDTFPWPSWIVAVTISMPGARRQMCIASRSHVAAVSMVLPTDCGRTASTLIIAHSILSWRVMDPATPALWICTVLTVERKRSRLVRARISVRKKVHERKRPHKGSHYSIAGCNILVILPRLETGLCQVACHDWRPLLCHVVLRSLAS
jgi:hypothetical protein